MQSSEDLERFITWVNTKFEHICKTRTRCRTAIDALEDLLRNKKDPLDEIKKLFMSKFPDFATPLSSDTDSACEKALVELIFRLRIAMARFKIADTLDAEEEEEK